MPKIASPATLIFSEICDKVTSFYEKNWYNESIMKARKEDGYMKRYVCTVCGYVYDEEAEGVKFADLPDDWVCPLCGAGKDQFEEE